MVGWMQQQMSQTAKAPAGPGLRLGNPRDYADLRVEGAVLVVELAGAVPLALVREALARGRQDGWITAARPSLIDLSHFTGNIDWAELRAISQMADWTPPGGRILPVAYVSDHALFIMLLKLVQVFFPWAQHRAFSRRDWALDWLMRETRTAETEIAAG